MAPSNRMMPDADLTALVRAIVESSDDAIIGKALDGRIVSWNHGAERAYGYTAGEAIGQSITLIIPADRRAEQDRILSEIRAGRRVPSHETMRVTRDGRE